ncbi:hypothetical protein BDQ94DRAFT_147616 [Aspergillus welwitschiae]|uniref:Uncharacterized protein n=1 Tax=Aspergillus welwitschiae TaxID=1341132 RepID=A0A3F3PW91_9EURO|nr:hypothetical protein BDQ94DRAFT_147616 [Aspergillus welwitschiae]RDH31179.1 hypothetical protein BDQ94DRAFT_147616 [Aspergillus welwitschiae]
MGLLSLRELLCLSINFSGDSLIGARNKPQKIILRGYLEYEGACSFPVIHSWVCRGIYCGSIT